MVSRATLLRFHCVLTGEFRVLVVEVNGHEELGPPVTQQSLTFRELKSIQIG